MLWHYTSLIRLKQILHAGALRPNSYEGERASVWFSSNQTWEATARKRVNTMTRRLTFEEMVVLLGLGRIGIERDDLITYDEWCAEAKLGLEFTTSLTLGGVELGGDPDEWFASFEPVTSRDWRSVQIWHDNRWTNLEEL